METSAVKVLIIDDEEDICLMLEECLKDEYKEEVEIKTFLDAKDAIDYIKTNALDIIITDMNFPQFSGRDIIREAQKINGSTKGVLVTGESGDEVAKYAHDSGLYLLRKPFNFDEFINLVAPFIRR
ncbi:MAG: response regulator [Oligoflexia bacterium]|nr:response regulator [Oligoflexia bacterium]